MFWTAVLYNFAKKSWFQIIYVFFFFYLYETIGLIQVTKQIWELSIEECYENIRKSVSKKTIFSSI